VPSFAVAFAVCRDVRPYPCGRAPGIVGDGKTSELSPAEERIMTNTEYQFSFRGESGVDLLERLLEEWRGKIDELLVQVDLASKDVSEDVRSRATAAENAYLAAKSQLREIPKDAGSNLGALRSGIEKLLDDLRQAYQSAEAAVRRSRPE
jgi:ElaB/YqjD/DUF883 family membrane-anchored ribosome-binding protein